MHEQGSERILNLLNQNLSRIITSDPLITLNEEVLQEIVAGSSPGEIEFARHRIYEKMREVRNQNTSTHLAIVAFMCKMTGATPEEEKKAVSWYQEKIEDTPQYLLVEDELVPILTEFFERQLFCIMSQFPAETHTAIVGSLMEAFFSLEDTALHGEFCPVKDCKTRRKQDWHLTCLLCWEKVPFATQQKIYHLHYSSPDSPAYTMASHKVLNILNNGLSEGDTWP